MDTSKMSLFDKTLLAAIDAANEEYLRQLNAGEPLDQRKVEQAALQTMIIGMTTIEKGD